MIESTKQLVSDCSTISGTLNKIAEISSDLYNVHKKFNTTVKSHKWDRMQDVYAAINQSMITWEKSLKKQVETMQNYMLKSFKYSLKEFESFNEVGEAYLGGEAAKHGGTGVLQVLGGPREQEGEAVHDGRGAEVGG